MQAARPASAVGPCFGIGEMGHLRRFCTKTTPGPARWYPSDYYIRCMDKGKKGSVDGVEAKGKEKCARGVNTVNEGVKLLSESCEKEITYGNTGLPGREIICCDRSAGDGKEVGKQ